MSEIAHSQNDMRYVTGLRYLFSRKQLNKHMDDLLIITKSDTVRNQLQIYSKTDPTDDSLYKLPCTR